MALLRADTLTLTSRLLHPNRRYAVDDIASAAPTADWSTSLVYDSQQDLPVLPFLQNSATISTPEVTDMWILDYAELDLPDGQLYIPAGELSARLWLRGNRSLPTNATVTVIFGTVDQDSMQQERLYATTTATVSLQLSQVTEVLLDLGTVPKLVLQPNETLRFYFYVDSTGGGVGGQHAVEMLVGTETSALGVPQTPSISLPGPIGILYERELAGSLGVAGQRGALQVRLGKTLQVALESSLRRSAALWRSVLAATALEALSGPRAINLAARRALVSVQLDVTRRMQLARAAVLQLAASVHKRTGKFLASALTLVVQLERKLLAIRAFSSALSLNGAFVRKLRAYRLAVANVTSSVGGAINVPFNSLPFGQGVATIVKKVIQVFDD